MDFLRRPRPSGSVALRELVDWLESVLPGGEVQTFPTRSGTGRNYILRHRPDQPPRWIFGTHIDTHPDSFGFNDGFSGVLFLIRLYPFVLERDIPAIFCFFDNEEVVGEVSRRGWEVIGEMGSAHFVLSDKFVRPTVGTLIFDMLLSEGTPPYPCEFLSYEYEFNRPFLRRFIPHLISDRHGVRLLDDHIPFLLVGCPVALFIGWGDKYWHTPDDRPENYTDSNLHVLYEALTPILEHRTYAVEKLRNFPS